MLRHQSNPWQEKYQNYIMLQVSKSPVHVSQTVIKPRNVAYEIWNDSVSEYFNPWSWQDWKFTRIQISGNGKAWIFGRSYWKFENQVTGRLGIYERKIKVNMIATRGNNIPVILGKCKWTTVLKRHQNFLKQNNRCWIFCPKQSVRHCWKVWKGMEETTDKSNHKTIISKLVDNLSHQKQLSPDGKKPRIKSFK